MTTTKNEKKPGPRRRPLCQFGGFPDQRARLAAAGYPKFLFRLAFARRGWVEMSAVPRRHD
jgi:hypothetical protein